MTESEQTRALDRWEGEGGPDLPAWVVGLPVDALADAERRVLFALGAAVVAQWTTLSTEQQRALFRQAAGGAPTTAALGEQIARFLHDHKDDAATA